MDLGLNGKKALVTGASSGLGKSIAIALAEEGAKVAIVSRTKSDLEEVLENIGGRKKGHYMITQDLALIGSPEKVFVDLKQNWGNLDILVNNVGGTLDIKDPLCSIRDWQKIWRINMEVTIELTNLSLTYMRNQKWGRIVNISSISALENQGPVPYCSIKAALTSYTRSIGRIFASDGVMINSVLPGAVLTEKGYWNTSSKNNPEHVEKYLNERMAIKRFGKPEEISKIVTFLCSEYASFFVGSAVLVDGGQGRCFQNEY